MKAKIFKPIKTKILYLFFLFTFLYSSGQSTIYLENFDGQDGKGASGSSPTVDLSGVDWTIDFSDADLSNNYKFEVITVTGNAIFQARNVGTSIWLSPSIDISSFVNISLTLDASQAGNSLDATDSLITQYRIDGGTWTNAETNGLLTGNYEISVVSQLELEGSTLEIRVVATNNANPERQRFDNILVSGFNVVSYVYDDAWSPSDPNGVSTLLDDITVINGAANINTNTNCNTFMVNSTGSVTIDSGVTLTIDGEMTLESSSTRYASLISDGTITGDVVYKRHVNNAAGTGTTTTANDLVSAPLTGQTFSAFRAANSNILSGTIGGNLAFLFGPFNSATETYINYSDLDDTSTLDAGKGYRTGSTDGTTYTFTGTIETGTVITPIVSGGMSNWNLIGNPYPSYLNVQDFLNNVTNTGLMDEDAVGMYGYDGTATDDWVIYNLATTTASTLITPGQGFFIDAESSGNIQFTPNMRATGSSDDFIAGRNSNPLVFLKLNVSNSTKNYNTDFYFNDNASLSLDQGYDATIWNDTAPSFSLYSHLVENNSGKAMALQALHSNDLMNVTIPLGVNANNSSDIVFTISESTIPDTINVYLEDTVENTSTLLTSEDYVMTPNLALNGTGRFYLRFVANQLNVQDIELQTLNIFTNHSQKTIVIEGSLKQPTSFELFDIQGRMVTNSNLIQQSYRQTIDVSELSAGIYIVKLRNAVSTKTQKIILR
jgi:hypothetical protein